MDAAEQVYKDGNGEDKKKYVIGVAENYIEKSGIKIDLDDLEAQIEAAVFGKFTKIE